MVEQLLLILLVLFALLAIQQRQLRIAVIFLSVFSLLSSLLYLYVNAPDVAMAEAAIGSTIATVLFLVTLRKQEWIKNISDVSQASVNEQNRKDIRQHRIRSVLLVVVLFVLFIYIYERSGLRTLAPVTVVADLYRQSFFADTGSQNAVTAIYLHYRIYDTFFETLTLLISVMGVVFFSRSQLHAESGILTHSRSPGRIVRQHHDQQVTGRVIGLLYPFVFMVGVYIILNGHLTPGGGFQGGAILSAVLIIRYLSMPGNDIRVQVLQTIEKVMFILIVLVPVLYIFTNVSRLHPVYLVPYLIVLNVLIGIKVGCGISIVFFRFVFFESR